jgi:hypothetical protein
LGGGGILRANIMALLHPEKVGIGAFEGGDPNDPPGGLAAYYTAANDAIIFNNAVKNIGFRWYHTWHPYALTGDDGSVKRLPAWWQSGDLTQAKLDAMRANGNIIIGTNEPWSGKFGMTVDETIAVWPQLMALPNRLASPSGAPGGGDQWLADFMAKIAQNGFRVDVINTHYYTTNTNVTSAVSDFRTYLTNLHNTYNRPIIITEWALAAFPGPGTSPTEHANGVPPPFTYAQQIAYMQAAVQMLDTLDFVELHSWYAATNDGSDYENNNIINGDGSRTPLGDAFAQIISGQTSSTTTLIAEFYKNGILVGTATNLPTGTLYPILSLANNTESATANFGSSPLSFLPNGMTSWDGSQIGTGATGTTTSAVALSTTDKAPSVVLSNGNLTATSSGTSGAVRGVQSGVADRYFEVKFGTIATGAGTPGIGVANATQALTNSYPGDPNGVGWFASGYTEWPQSGTSYNFGTFATGDVLGVLLKASSVQFYKNGSLVGTAVTLPAGQLYPIISLANGTDSATVNFGATPLSFLPAGAASWDGSQVKSGGGGAVGGGGTITVGGFVCDGDSLTRGAAQDGNPVTPYPTQLAGLTGKSVINLGIDGQSIATMDANYAANVAPRFNASTANVLILEGGANDIVGNVTASQIDASVRSYCAKARATGYKVYLLTMPPFPQGGIIGGAPSPTIAAVNADRRANWAQYCDGLVDIAANSAFSDDTNRTYFQADQTHWTTAADTVVANMVKTAVLG